MQGPGRAYIVNAGSGESKYSECRVQGERIKSLQGSGRPDIVYAESGESGYSECRVRGERIY
ncbi:unnamed protein product [Staurois parvus]|uniref:Uncharacterized protein n=1 Tax=Staurois parvus TaxID=386267 RepID=A0ABN9B1G3_9NEOB|nr:unnamed protein product [Staurois parvus]